MSDEKPKTYLDIILNARTLTKATILALHAAIADDQKKASEEQAKILKKQTSILKTTEKIYLFLLLFTIFNVLIFGLSVLLNNLSWIENASLKATLFTSVIILMCAAALITLAVFISFIIKPKDD